MATMLKQSTFCVRFHPLLSAAIAVTASLNLSRAHPSTLVLADYSAISIVFVFMYLRICSVNTQYGSIFYFWQGLIRYTRTRNPLNNGTSKILSADVLTHNCNCFEFFPTNSTWTKIFWIKWHDADWALSSTVFQLGKSFVICKDSFLGRRKTYP